MIVAGSFGRHRFAHDAPEESARWVAGNNIRIDAIAKLMFVQALCSVFRFAIFVCAFSPYGICDAGTSHEVAFVAAIHEYLGTNGSMWCYFRIRSVFECNALHLVAHLLCTDYAPLVPDVGRVLDAGFVEETTESGQRDFRFEVEGRRCHAVVLTDATVELSGKAFDDAPMACAVANVSPAQSAGCQSAQTFCSGDEQHRFSFKFSRICSHNAGRRTAIDADVNFFFCSSHLFCLDIQCRYKASSRE